MLESQRNFGLTIEHAMDVLGWTGLNPILGGSPSEGTDGGKHRQSGGDKERRDEDEVEDVRKRLGDDA